ncbi:MAG: SAM-dependent methyltransferase, partial [Deltaproteobacteria bacterium]|nr:SAM-dependent methyltransferase [Deltaproteobacteria bacterium]
HAGVKLGLFTLISNEEIDAQGIGERLGCDVRGITMLLNALVAMGLLIKKQDKYANTDASKSLLIKESPRYIGYMIMHHHHLVETWSRLDNAVRSGKPVRERGLRDKQELESFLMGMFNLAMGIAPQVAREIDLKGKNHLLDLGGGPGTYAIHFCMANPDLKATVFDLSATRPFAEKTIAQFGLSDRIGFIPGNYLEDEIEGTYDVAWLSHIFHGEGPDACQMIVEKTISAMAQGGLVLVHDFILNDTFDGPMFPALFSLNMLVNTEKGRAYSGDQIKGMLEKAGLKNIRRLSFKGPNESGIITGVV